MKVRGVSANDLKLGLLDLATVTVTFNPDCVLLRDQLISLPENCLKILIDNASGSLAQECLRQLSSDVKNVLVVNNSTNRGLAAAINQGVKVARSRIPNAKYCLLLDQDSVPRPGSVETLVSEFDALRSAGVRVASVGPQLIDGVTGLSYGFHQATRWRWKRVYPDSNVAQIPCASLNGSGTLVPIDLFLQFGGLDECLFIDHVDSEWSFRVRAGGFMLFGIPGALFSHRMGENSLRYWFLGWRVWPSRSALRHRFLFRNAVSLMRRPYVPLVWKCWGMVKLTLTFTLHAVFGSQRLLQMKAMLSGIWAGIYSDLGHVEYGGR